VDRDPVHLRNTYNIEEELFDVLTKDIKEYEQYARRLSNGMPTIQKTLTF